jgi:outer membrane lipoprotein-sorting protein
MKTNKWIYVFAALPVLALLMAALPSQEPNALLKRVDEVMFSAKDMTAKNTITLIDKNNKSDVRVATIKQKGTDRRIFRFISPASQAGIAVLSLPNDVMYVYLPAFGKERRIASSAKNQSFAGTDFTYEDMEAVKYTDKYTPKFLREEGGLMVLELTPKVKSDYLKVILFSNKAQGYPEKMEYYDRAGKKVKESVYTFKKIGKYWNAETIEMTDLRKSHKTRLSMSDVKYDTGLSDDEFTVRKLKE